MREADKKLFMRVHAIPGEYSNTYFIDMPLAYRNVIKKDFIIRLSKTEVWLFNFTEEDKDIWTSADGDIEISEMETSHIRNTLNMINDLVSRGRMEYPIQYDTLFNELANRGYKTDDELDEIYKPL